MRIFSGIQPTGEKHLGNYIGGFRQYAHTQELGEAFFCIVDLHSITVEHDPADLHDRTLDLFSMLIATGLSGETSSSSAAVIRNPSPSASGSRRKILSPGSTSATDCFTFARMSAFVFSSSSVP